MADYYHWRTGGGKHHKGGPHPNRLPMSVGKQQRKLAVEVAAPAYRRPQARTLAKAIHENDAMDRQASGNPMMSLQIRHVVATRTGRRPVLVAGAARSRRGVRSLSHASTVYS